MALRWGIVSNVELANDFVNALSTLPSDEHSIVAIAAGNKFLAEEFAKIHEIPTVYADCTDLAESKDIDVVYIGAMNSQHFEIGMMMLEHGKHVLIEKPLCTNEKQAKKIITYAERKKLFLMEGVWSRFFPAYQYIRKQIASGMLGTIEEINVTLGFDLMDIERVQNKIFGSGAILALGIYPIQLSQWAFQEPPISIKATGDLNDDGVDLSIDAELHYSGGRVTRFQTSAKKQLENNAVIKGSKGQITLPNFWCPTSIVDIDGKQKEWVLPKGKLMNNFPNSEGLRYEIEEVRMCIMEGKLQSEHMNHNESLLLAHIEDSIRKEVGAYWQD